MANNDTIKVVSPSGARFDVMTEEEAEYFERIAAEYYSDNILANIADRQDLDRVLMMELLVYRWSSWLMSESDYYGDKIDPSEFKTQLKDYCVDESTEIMTRCGWKTYDELEIGEEVLTIALDGDAEWQELEEVHTFNDSVVSVIETRDHSSVTTMHHDWVVKSAYVDSGIYKIPTWKLGPNHALVKAAKGGASKSKTISDDFVELVAWYWTEGSALLHENGNFYNCGISQSKNNKNYCLKIEQTLVNLYGERSEGKMYGGGCQWRTIERENGVVLYMFNKAVCAQLQTAFVDFKKKILLSEFIVSLTQEQLDLFIDVSQSADGWETSSLNGDKTYRNLSQRSLARVKAYEMVLVLAGLPVRTRFQNDDMWRVNIPVDRNICPMRALNASDRSPEFRVEPLVWCPQTKNGTWLARRDGCIYYTGNSNEIRQTKKMLGIDKKSREGEGQTVADYIENLRQRAKEFGVMRNDQAAKAIELFQELSAFIMLHDNTDDVERKEQHCNQEDIINWIREIAIPEFNEIDAKFRETSQKYWIQEI